MYRVTVSPEPGVNAVYEIHSDHRLVAEVRAQTMAMRAFGKKYGEVRLVGIEKVAPAVTEATNLHPVFKNIFAPILSRKLGV